MQAFIDNYVTKYGTPRTLHTDHRRQFESSLFKQLCNLLRINKTHTTLYYQQSDGIVERMNPCTLKYVVNVHRFKSEELGWKPSSGLVYMAYRSAEHGSSRFTSNYLTFGRGVVLPVELVTALSAHQKRSTEEYINVLEDALGTAHEIAKIICQTLWNNKKLRSDSRLSWKKFEFGNKVWPYTAKRTKSILPKFQKWWTRPYTLQQEFSDVTYQIKGQGSSCSLCW